MPVPTVNVNMQYPQLHMLTDACIVSNLLFKKKKIYVLFGSWATLTLKVGSIGAGHTETVELGSSTEMARSFH